MVRRCRPPSQGWALLRNHAPDIAAMDLFVVPTIGFDLLYVLAVVRLARNCLDRCHISSDRGMDCPPDHGLQHSQAALRPRLPEPRAIRGSQRPGSKPPRGAHSTWRLVFDRAQLAPPTPRRWLRSSVGPSL